jgi:hypothetical protein
MSWVTVASIVVFRSSMEVAMSNWNLVGFLCGARSEQMGAREKISPRIDGALDTKLSRSGWAVVNLGEFEVSLLRTEQSLVQKRWNR